MEPQTRNLAVPRNNHFQGIKCSLLDGKNTKITSNNSKQHQTTLPYYSRLFVSCSLWILVFLAPPLQRGSNARAQKDSGSGVTATRNPQNVQPVGSFNMGVSINGGTSKYPKSSVFMVFSIINQPLWGYPIYGTPYMGAPDKGNPQNHWCQYLKL